MCVIKKSHSTQQQMPINFYLDSVFNLYTTTTMYMYEQIESNSLQQF